MKHNTLIRTWMTMMGLIMVMVMMPMVPAMGQQVLYQGDTITVSYTTGGHTYYVARKGNTNQIEVVRDNPTESCLWVLTKITGAASPANGKENGAVVEAKSLTAMKAGAANQYFNLAVSNNGAPTLTAKAQSIYTIKSSQSVPEGYFNGYVLAKSGRNNYYLYYNSTFRSTTSSSSRQILRIQKWHHVTIAEHEPSFLPHSTIFGYAKNEDAANAQAVDVTCRVIKRSGEYFENVSNPGQRIIIDELKETDADGSATFNWKYGNDQMQITSPTYNSVTKTYSFQVKPIGASPVLTPQDTAVNPLKDIEDAIVCSATIDGQPVTSEMYCIRRKYLKVAPSVLTFKVSHHSYTFPAGGTDGERTISLDPELLYRTGYDWYNTDGIVERTTVETNRVEYAFPGLVVRTEPAAAATWLHFIGYGPLAINLQAEANDAVNAPKRSGQVVITVEYGEYELAGEEYTGTRYSLRPSTTKTGTDEHGNRYQEYYEDNEHGTYKRVAFDSFIRQVTLAQLGDQTDDAEIIFHNKGVEPGKFNNQQAVHTNKQIRYYIPGDGSSYGSDVELRPAEKSFYAYRRWYNYDTGRGIQNSEDANNNTMWSDAPHIEVTNNRVTTSLNYTPINTDNVNSRGVFAIKRDGTGTPTTSSGYKILYSDMTDPTPVIKGYKNAVGGPHNDGVHTIACDLSCYTDYDIQTVAGKLNITEPTLSYRMLFELRPATEIADKIRDLQAEEYLEEYEYTAPTGVDVHLVTSQRFRSYRYHVSELGYFYYDNSTIKRIQGTNTTIRWQRSIDGGSATAFTPTYSANTDNAIVNSRTAGDVVYTLEINAGSAWRRIAKFTVHYKNAAEVGPSASPLLTNQEIQRRYQVLEKVDWDTLPGKSSADNVFAKAHLKWEDATFGFAYQHSDYELSNYNGSKKNNRGGNTDFCYYGEYILLNSWKPGSGYTWMDKNIVNHTGQGNGFMLFADGTMEPSMVASINTGTSICSGQQMYCSAWVANACPSTGSGDLPIFRFNVQGRNRDDEEWHDVEVFFAGSLPKGSGWRQVLFPVSSSNSYEQTRVCVYNFATSNTGNDFFLDDIYLFASPLPISAYQAESACSGEDIVVVVKVDYQNVADQFVNKEVYYQGWVERTANNVVSIPDLADFNGYYMWHNGSDTYSIQSKDEADGVAEPKQNVGKIHIPKKTFVPNVSDVYPSVQAFIDHLHAILYTEKESRAGVFYIQENDHYAMYIAHLLRAQNGGHYEVRFAESVAELTHPQCAMSVKLPIYKQTQLTWGNNGEPLNKQELDVCPNVNNEIKVTVTNRHIADTVSAETTLGRADWLVGIPADSIYSGVYVEHNDSRTDEKLKEEKLVRLNAKKTTAPDVYYTIAELKKIADTAYLAYYGYTRQEVIDAFVYDLRRMPYINNPNDNYDVSDHTKLIKEAFHSERHYEIVKNICEKGLVRLNVSSHTVTLSPGDSLYLWVFPIVGSATMGDDVLAVCNEPQWVELHTSQIADETQQQIFNPSPIANENKTPAEKMMTPKVRVGASQANKSFQVPVMDLQNAVLGWDSLRVIGTNDSVVQDSIRNSTGANPFRMRYYADRVYQGTNGLLYTDDNYRSDTKNGAYDKTTNPSGWRYYHPGDSIIFKPIDAAYVDYLADRREQSKHIGVENDLLKDVPSVYSASDANWVTKQATEHTDLQPGYQHANSVGAVMKAGYTYHMKTNLVTNSFAGELGGKNDSTGCSYGVSFFDIEVVPDLLIWHPTVSNEWGNDANWHGIVGGREMDWGFAPLSSSSVIIPKLDNPLLYPVVTGDTLYRMVAHYEPASCDNIYLEAGARILGQEKLRYKKAYVDMPIPATKQQAMSAPLQGMYSGDFFIPQNATASTEQWPYGKTDGKVSSLRVGHTGVVADNGTLFNPKTYEGTRSSTAPYAFWVAYYNHTVKTYNYGTDPGQFVVHTATASFTESNSLNEPIAVGQGIKVLGFGPGDNPEEVIPLRLPKVDDSYKYFLYGQETSYSASTPRSNSFRFAWEPNGDGNMTLHLSNGTASTQFFLGNPTMAYVDLEMFMEANKSVLTGAFAYMNNDTWISVTKDIIHISGHRFLAPMEAILVQATDTNTTLDVVLKEEHLTLDNMTFAGAPSREPHGSAAPRRAEADEPIQLMTITTYTDEMEAVAYLGKKSHARHAYLQGEDALFVSSGIEGNSNPDAMLTPMNIYTVSDSNALSVDLRPGITMVPLRFLVHEAYRTDSVNIIFNMNTEWLTECYLVDSIAGTREPIMNGFLMKIATPGNHQNRYYIEGPDAFVPDPVLPDDPGIATRLEEENTLAPGIYDHVEKFIEDNTIYIRLGKKVYDARGQRVK